MGVRKKDQVKRGADPSGPSRIGTAIGALRLNGDVARRQELLSETEPGPEVGGGISYFSGLGAAALRSLIGERFIDPTERQNNSPTAADFLAFMDSHPSTTAIGYAISPEREDYRITIEGLVLSLPYTEGDEQEFRAFCEGADELFLVDSCVGHGLRAWWD